MMVEILKEYIEDGVKITEYTKDGESVSHIVRESILVNHPIVKEDTEVEDRLSLLEQLVADLASLLLGV